MEAAWRCGVQRAERGAGQDAGGGGLNVAYKLPSAEPGQGSGGLAVA